MSSSADLYLEGLERQDFAEDFAIEAGVLRPCEWHIGFYSQESWDLVPMYRNAAWQFKRGEIPGRLFVSQKDFTDTLKSVVEEAPISCPRCESLRAED
jgi:hypothetical protein